MHDASIVAAISHDAGGAEVLSSYIRRNDLNCVYVLDGPARSVFSRKLGAIDNLSLAEAVAKSSWVLCGTSWQADLECDAIVQARAAGKRVVAFLDHWTNYRERFIRDGVEALPDEIWVGDRYGLQLAQHIFPTLPVSLVENPYFLDLDLELHDARTRRGVRTSNDEMRILFVCEPVSEHARLRFGNERHWGYTEEDVVRYFLENTDAITVSINSIIFRPHPAETAAKYAWVKHATSHNVIISSDHLLIDEITDADMVVGGNSMAMVVALIAGKRVVSCIPPGGAPCALPHDEIEHLRNLIAARDHIL